MTDHVVIELDERIFIGPTHCETTVSGWEIQGDTVIRAGIYDYRPWTDTERAENAALGARFSGRVCNNSVGYLIRCTMRLDGHPPVVTYALDLRDQQ